MSNSKRNILGLWILTNTFGFVLGMIFAVLSISVSWALYSSSNPYSNVFRFVSVLPASSVAFAQWLVLRRFFTGLRWWIVASVGGAILGWIIFTTENRLLMIFATLPVGCMQYLCIHQSFEKKILWVLASTIGLFSVFIAGPVGVALYVVLTGICLTKWERQTIEKNNG
ncbi:hypothetical protein [Phormidium tenue]|jgi:hypothetical protein|uniref:Uncharacterized protein n=1 Tax=Phormidium tenue FACHB-1050 TaxID=2692857 RepID=A0ABR8CA78_9CYAN|nr:hypothetical protein [Phormidium tenue]MBD2317589.1 hypothetical protein [Phormidium tenue FACHB-1050]